MIHHTTARGNGLTRILVSHEMFDDITAEKWKFGISMNTGVNINAHSLCWLSSQAAHIIYGKKKINDMRALHFVSWVQHPVNPVWPGLVSWWFNRSSAGVHLIPHEYHIYKSSYSQLVVERCRENRSEFMALSLTEINTSLPLAAEVS